MPAHAKQACDGCNIRKIKCLGDYPCVRCVDHGLTCTFLRQRRKSGPRTIRQKSLQKIWRGQAESAQRFGESMQYGEASMFEPVPALQQIPLVILSIALRMYKENLYGIWPLLNVEHLIRQLSNEPSNPEIYALATSLSGATLSNLDQVILHESLLEPVSAEAFIKESRRARATFDYMEPVTLNTTLTSYFLHIFYGRQPLHKQTAVFYIREAITFAQLCGMHIEETYSQFNIKDQQVMRKLYFLLFMTERYLCIQDGLPTVLESISLPITENEEAPEVVSGFLNLVTLFSTPGTGFFNKWTSRSQNVSIDRERLVLIQHALQRRLEISKDSNDIQNVDIIVSQHWIRSLAWKLSIQLGYVNLNSRKEMNITYPLEIAQDTLGAVSSFSPRSFEVHGPGMEVKMYEIISALADSILCKPEEEQSSLLFGPREMLRSLAGIMYSLNIKSPDLRNKLSGKLEAIFGEIQIPPSLSLIDELEEFDFAGKTDDLPLGLFSFGLEEFPTFI